MKKVIIVNEEEFQKFLVNIKAEFDYEDEYYIQESVVNSLSEEQKLELLMFAEKYTIRVYTTHRFSAFRVQVFLAELSDKYALLLK